MAIAEWSPIRRLVVSPIKENGLVDLVDQETRYSVAKDIYPPVAEELLDAVRMAIEFEKTRVGLSDPTKP